jgi:glycine dehydrogenase subunit 1
MLKTIGVSSFEEMLSSLPPEVRVKDSWEGKGLSEMDLFRKYKRFAEENAPTSQVDSYLGGGAYEHFIPSVVKHLGSKPEFLTSYTQYQPESNQGMLQALFEYQSMMCRLTGMEVSNASHYDGGTSLMEAVLMALRKKSGRVLFSSYLNPLWKRVLKTYFSETPEILFEVTPPTGILRGTELENISALIVQNPNYLGMLEDVETLASDAHSKNVTLIAAVNPIALGLLEAPGKLGVDIVVGEGQALGNALSYGGPYFGFMCVKKDWMRRMPGRIVGQTVDRDGRRGFVLTLQTREQHIRREKALSSICTNKALCALRAAIYLAYLGESGFQSVAQECFEKAHYVQEKLCHIEGLRLTFDQPFFNEFTLHLEKKKKSLSDVLLYLRQNNILGGIVQQADYPHLSSDITIAVTETKTQEQLDRLIAVWKRALV